MAGRFQDFIGSAFGPVSRAVDRVRPRWTYAKGPKSRADLLPASAAAPPPPAKVKLRFEPRALFFGEARPRRLFAAGLENSPAPNPDILLGRQSKVSASLSPRYVEIERSLREEMRGLDSVEMGNSAVIGAELGRALLDRAVASSTESLARVALWASGAGTVAFAVGSYLRSGSDPFGYGALYFGAGFIGALIIAAAALAAGAGANAKFAKGQENLAALVGRTTGEFRAKLIELRAGMRPTGGSFGEAIRAAGEARMTTIAAMRFFDRSPAIGAAGDGHQCAVLAERLQSAAKASLSSGLAMGVVVAAVAGACVTYLLLQPLALVPFLSAEGARPGIVILPMAISALLAFPLLAGPLIATLNAAGDPGAVLKAEPVRSLADGLRGAALSAAAETETDMIAAYAEALDKLESKAGSGSAAASNDDSPGWRRGADAPRFVGLGFQSAPPSFTADAPKASALRKLFGGPRPKRG